MWMFDFQILQRSIRVFNPKFFFKLITFNPCFTMALFKPIKGTTSQIVPSETRSRYSNKFGSFILLRLNQFFS